MLVTLAGEKGHPSQPQHVGRAIDEEQPHQQAPGPPRSLLDEQQRVRREERGDQPVADRPLHGEIQLVRIGKIGIHTPQVAEGEVQGRLPSPSARPGGDLLGRGRLAPEDLTKVHKPFQADAEVVRRVMEREIGELVRGRGGLMCVTTGGEVGTCVLGPLLIVSTVVRVRRELSRCVTTKYHDPWEWSLAL